MRQVRWIYSRYSHVYPIRFCQKGIILTLTNSIFFFKKKKESERELDLYNF